MAIEWYDLPLINDVEEWSESNRPRYAKVGDFILLSGAVTNISEDSTQIGFLPMGFRPKSSKYFVQNSSIHGDEISIVRWFLTTNGNLYMQHQSYGKKNGYDNTDWYPIDIVLPI